MKRSSTTSGVNAGHVESPSGADEAPNEAKGAAPTAPAPLVTPPSERDEIQNAADLIGEARLHYMAKFGEPSAAPEAWGIALRLARQVVATMSADQVYRSGSTGSAATS